LIPARRAAGRARPRVIVGTAGPSRIGRRRSLPQGRRDRGAERRRGVRAANTDRQGQGSRSRARSSADARARCCSTTMNMDAEQGQDRRPVGVGRDRIAYETRARRARRACRAGAMSEVAGRMSTGRRAISREGEGRHRHHAGGPVQGVRAKGRGAGGGVSGHQRGARSDGHGGYVTADDRTLAEAALRARTCSFGSQLHSSTRRSRP